MTSKFQKLKWAMFQNKYKKLTIYGLKHNFIAPYDDELIEKLRNIYYGGVPASIILLSNGLSNGHCYDRALLMSRAFLAEDGDVQLVYASVDSLRLNPQFTNNKDTSYADHCIVERTTKDGHHLIYDTSTGFIYDKDLYWMLEKPKVRKVNNKDLIIKFVQSEEYYHPEDIERDKYVLPLILPMIEKTCGSPTEMYSLLGVDLLQREIEHFKESIDYDGVCREIDDDMRRLRLRK